VRGPRVREPGARKPVFLYLRGQDRLIVAVDLRTSGSYFLLSDLTGREIAFQTCSPIVSAEEVIEERVDHIHNLLQKRLHNHALGV